jgi:hypothetical protein
MSPSISEAGYDMNMGKVADCSPVRCLLDLAIPWLPSPVLVHHKSHARRFGIFDDSLAGFEVVGQRFLANDVDLSLSGIGANFGVAMRRRNDINEVRPLNLDRASPIAVVAGYAV